MKKALIVIFLSSINLFATVWSSTEKSKIESAFQEFNQFVKEQNDKIVNRWKELNSGTIENILNEIQEKNRLSKDIKDLLKDEDLKQKEMLFEIIKMKNLKNIEIQNEKVNYKGVEK